MIFKERAERIAEEWIRAWNSHELETIISHYDDDIEFTSPFVVKLTGNSSGTIKGKEDLRHYFQKGITAYPDLRFELLKLFTGVTSLTLYYRGVTGLLAAEVMILNSKGKITRVIAHYDHD